MPTSDGDFVLYRAASRQVTAEGCKNLLLAGVSATLRDEGLVQERDIGANFLLTGQDVGQNVR